MRALGDAHTREQHERRWLTIELKKLLAWFLLSVAGVGLLLWIEQPATRRTELRISSPIVPGAPWAGGEWPNLRALRRSAAMPPWVSESESAIAPPAASQEEKPPLSLTATPEDEWGSPVPRVPTRLASLPVLIPISATRKEEKSPPTESIPILATTEPLLTMLAYRPPGARDEGESQLVLIAPELLAFVAPSWSAATAPFRLQEGNHVRPITRLRNAGDFDWIQFERDGALWWVPAEFFVRLASPRAFPFSARANLPFGAEPVDRNTPLPPDYEPSDLVPVATEFVLGPKTILLRREAAEALETMLRAARRDGCELRVFSGFRNFATQKRLYLEAIASQGPKQNGTAAPGYSEHQLGTTVDISNTDPAMVLSERFGTTPEGRWLFRHAAQFGFIHSYTEENTLEAGYKPEPWHLRYVGPQRASQILASRASGAGEP